MVATWSTDSSLQAGFVAALPRRVTASVGDSSVEGDAGTSDGVEESAWLVTAPDFCALLPPGVLPQAARARDIATATGTAYQR